jgi:hypothetical protein
MKILCIDCINNGGLLFSEFFNGMQLYGHRCYWYSAGNQSGFITDHYQNIETGDVMPGTEDFDAAVVFTANLETYHYNLPIPGLVIQVKSAKKTGNVVKIGCIRHSELTRMIDIPVPYSGNPLTFPSQEDVIDLLRSVIIGQDLQDLRILISAGPTIEDLDPVRYLTNRSTGRMGIALARAAFRRGADVNLVHGTLSVRVPGYLTGKQVRSASDMADRILDLFQVSDVYIATAAVADYTPEKTAIKKIKKQSGDLVLKLNRTTDILATLGKRKQSHQMLVGFSVETDNELDNSRKKLIQKQLDMIVINNPTIEGAGFASETNMVTILTRDDQVLSIPLASKQDIADKVLDTIISLHNRR